MKFALALTASKTPSWPLYRGTLRNRTDIRAAVQESGQLTKKNISSLMVRGSAKWSLTARTASSVSLTHGDTATGTGVKYDPSTYQQLPAHRSRGTATLDPSIPSLSRSAVANISTVRGSPIRSLRECHHRFRSPGAASRAIAREAPMCFLHVRDALLL